MPNIEPFEKHAEEYESWFDRHPWAFQSELAAVRALAPLDGDGVEIGVGTGRFAAPLGIRIGVEPSARMRALARARGIRVLEGVAENLPLQDASFDYALLLTTICFVDDVRSAFKESFRILRPKGVMLVGFVDKDSVLGREYQRKKAVSRFYSTARFYSVDDVQRFAREAGFTRFSCVQTLFKDIRQMDAADPVKEGAGLGSFVVLRMDKT